MHKNSEKTGEDDVTIFLKVLLNAQRFCCCHQLISEALSVPGIRLLVTNAECKGTFPVDSVTWETFWLPRSPVM